MLLALAAGLLVGGCSSEDEPLGQPLPTPAPSPPASSPVPDGLQRFYTQDVGWQSCRGSFECATIDVPLDYDDPAGPTIELALLRAPATDPGARLGSLLVNPGGPGSSGVDYAANADLVVSPAVRAQYDVVGFDPRGVGASTPVECVTDAELNESFDTGDTTPDTPAEVAELLEGSAEFVQGCLDRSPQLLPHVGTQDVARDLDVLRAVLGDETLTYLGKSYGTSIGAEYARQFPERVGRMVLDGAVDPTLSDADVLLGQAEGFELALARFVEDCLAGGCPLGATEAEVLAVVDEVLARTDDAPLPTESRPLTQILATYGIIFPLYLPPEQGYEPLQAGLVAAQRGDGTVLLAIADAYLGRNPDGSFETNQWDVFSPVSCLDRPGEATPEQVQAVLPAFEAASPRFGEGLAWGLMGCNGWPVASQGLPAPVAASGAAPILVVGTTGDPATPYAWSQGLASQLDSGVLLTFEGTPHTAYRKGSACIDEAVDAYLLAGTPPSDGTTCR